MGKKKDDKASKKRGFVASMIGNKKSAEKSAADKENETAGEKKAVDKTAAETKEQRPEKGQRTAAERKRREVRAARTVKERRAKEKAAAAGKVAVAPKAGQDKPAKDKPVRERAARSRGSKEEQPKYSELRIDSGTFETTLSDKFLARKPWEAENPKHILSFMPGTVEEILVGKGDEVKAGDVLMIFRAMKMSNRMLSPVDGKVKAVNVGQGENVPKNLLMIELS